MADLIEMTVDSIRVHVPSNQHVVILKEKAAERYLPIWIGKAEANSIALKITGITPERPFTHDLVVNLLSAVDVSIDRVVVNSLANEVFYARIIGHLNGRSIEVDSRPSDAIAVAVRVGAGIFVSQEVLERAGLAEFDSGGETEEQENPHSEERIAQIREWVNTLDLPDLGEGEQPSDS
jgi:bifunctional DNase/RNase